MSVRFIVGRFFQFLTSQHYDYFILSVMHASYCYHNSYQETVLVNDDMPFDAFPFYCRQCH